MVVKQKSAAHILSMGGRPPIKNGIFMYIWGWLTMVLRTCMVYYLHRWVIFGINVYKC